MTSVLKTDDKIFTMYQQYRTLIHEETKKNDAFVYGIDQLAAQLTVAHMIDHVVCLLKNEKGESVIAGNEELEIMRNNAKLEDIPLCR